jgi:multidrug efflux pump
VSVIAVFLPLAYLSDTPGRLFGEFGVTVAASVAISAGRADALARALRARVLRRGGRETGLRAVLARGSDGLTSPTGLLRRAMAHRGATVAVGVAWFALGLGMLFAGAVGREFIPAADRGGFFVFTRAPEGATIEYTDRYHRQVEQIVRAAPEVIAPSR